MYDLYYYRRDEKKDINIPALNLRSVYERYVLVFFFYFTVLGTFNSRFYLRFVFMMNNSLHHFIF